jgi:hypothetical protein
MRLLLKAKAEVNAKNYDEYLSFLFIVLSFLFIVFSFLFSGTRRS